MKHHTSSTYLALPIGIAGYLLRPMRSGGYDMERINMFLNRVTKLLLLITLFSLITSAMGAVVEAPYLAYFWYLALFSIGLVILIFFAAGVGLTLMPLVKWFQKQRVLWDGRVVSISSSRGVNSLHHG
jgi:hypothetical protein